MSGIALSPYEAGILADGVYGVKEKAPFIADHRQVAAGFAGTLSANRFSTVMDRWNVIDGQRLEGRSGRGRFTKASGFAAIIPSRTGPPSTAVAIRGTASLADAITDASFISTSGPAGTRVHSGFFKVYETLIDDIVGALPGTGTVHVVGHSLGGGIGHLVAAHLAATRAGGVHLYSFGSPRAMAGSSATKLETSLGNDRMFRVFHWRDPVAKVPIWPYKHTPVGGSRYGIGDTGSLISPSAHSMSTSYLGIIKQGMSWSALRSGADPGDFHAQKGLELALQHNPVIMHGANGLYLITALIAKLVKSVVSRAALGLVSVGATMADHLAEMLFAAGQKTLQLGRTLAMLLAAIGRWAGKTVYDGASKTIAGIRYVLSLIERPLRMMSQRAILMATSPTAAATAALFI